MPRAGAAGRGEVAVGACLPGGFPVTGGAGVAAVITAVQGDLDGRQGAPRGVAAVGGRRLIRRTGLRHVDSPDAGRGDDLSGSQLWPGRCLGNPCCRFATAPGVPSRPRPAIAGLSAGKRAARSVSVKARGQRLIP